MDGLETVSDELWARVEPARVEAVSGLTCCQPLRDWQADGVWQRPHETVPAECNAAGRLDLHRALDPVRED